MDLIDERRKLSELTETALINNDIESLKKIKKIVRGNNEGFGDVSARKGGLIQGFPRIAKKGY